MINVQSQPPIPRLWGKVVPTVVLSKIFSFVSILDVLALSQIKTFANCAKATKEKRAGEVDAWITKYDPNTLFRTYIFNKPEPEILFSLLTFKKFQPNKKYDKGLSLFEYGCYNPEVVPPIIIRGLIESGAELNKLDCHGYFPLHNVVSNREYELAYFFIQKGANMNAADKRKLTILDYVQDGARLDAEQDAFCRYLLIHKAQTAQASCIDACTIL